MMDGVEIREVLRKSAGAFEHKGMRTAGGMKNAGGAPADGRDPLYRGIWDNYYRKLSLFVKLNLGYGQAEDTVQEIFCRIFASLHKYNPDYAFDTWIFAIARNYCTDFRRKNRRIIPEHSLSADEIDLKDNRYAVPENRIIQRETEQCIDKALQALPDDDRQIAFLRFYERLPLREIGGIMGMPLGTVKYRIHEIRKAVKTSLGDPG